MACRESSPRNESVPPPHRTCASASIGRHLISGLRKYSGTNRSDFGERTITESPGSKLPTPVVSVILPTYNRADLLVRAISSVVHQTFEAWELLVVDDGFQRPARYHVQSSADLRSSRIRRRRQGGIVAVPLRRRVR